METDKHGWNYKGCAQSTIVGARARERERERGDEGKSSCKLLSIALKYLCCRRLESTLEIELYALDEMQVARLQQWDTHTDETMNIRDAEKKRA